MANGLISCDDHMDLGQLPPDLWETRLPAALRDRAPHVEERDGQAVWICDGKVWGRWDGKPPATGSARPVKPIYNALDRAGIYDNSARRPADAELASRRHGSRRGADATDLRPDLPDFDRRSGAARGLLSGLQRLAAGFLRGRARPVDRRADAAGKPGRRVAGIDAAGRQRRGASGQPDDRQRQPEAR